jgi:hypothetical protein
MVVERQEIGSNQAHGRSHSKRSRPFRQGRTDPYKGIDAPASGASHRNGEGMSRCTAPCPTECLKISSPTAPLQGISTATRAVIAEEKGVKQLLVEGYGLREVMATEGQSSALLWGDEVFSLNSEWIMQESSEKRPRRITSSRLKRFWASKPPELASSKKSPTLWVRTDCTLILDTSCSWVILCASR